MSNDKPVTVKAWKAVITDSKQQAEILKAIGIQSVGIISLSADMEIGLTHIEANIYNRQDIIANFKSEGFTIEDED